MKKLLCVILVVVFCLGLLPTSVLAAPTTLKHVDITIELPDGGDEFDFSHIPTVTSFTSGSTDLLANGAGIMYAYWNGDYNLDDNGLPHFRSGGAYQVTLQLMFGSGYCTNGTMASTGETVAMPETFSATVNGVAATVRRNTSTYYPTIEVNLTLEGEVFNAEQKSERNEEWEQIKKARRSMNTPRTQEEAEAYNSNNMPEKVVVVNTDGTDLRYDFENMTTLVMDVNNAEKTTAYNLSPYTKEIWLSPETDPYKFIKAVKDSQWNSVGGYYYYEVSAEYPLYLAEATVFIPESRVSDFKQMIDDIDNVDLYPGGAFSIKCYSGDDVVAAQKAGASATKEICTDHKYTVQICSADRICHFADHDDHNLFYYSCGYCGKCEYNPNHVAYSNKAVNMGIINADSYKAIQRHGTVYAELPADAVYIGVNAAGEHVWWNSCELCGVFDHYSVNEYDWKATGTAIDTFAEYKASIVDAGNKKLEAQALNSTDRYYPGTFSLPLKSDAKISAWAQSDVNLALNDNLIDDAILGNDYTQNISRLQFCSVAVKLAEELTGKSITPADGDTFADTDNAYALKAYAAGITSGTSATTFEPNGTLNRQQMATFIYRTLRYVEQNSDYRYTDYTSKLANYTDSNQVQSWAEEAMAFMNALDLIKGTSDTTIDPEGLCTIEQAVAVAERSVYAHLLGWYQINRAKNMSPTSELGKAKMGGFELREGDYVWVTGRRYGAKVSTIDERTDIDSLFVPIINPFNGQAAEMKNGDLVPVRN